MPRANRSLRGVAVLAHLDLDAFFASVEENRDPSLRDKPVIVGGGERGVVATCNYIARRFGVHSAMPMSTARRLCPQAVVLAGDHRLYGDYSRRFIAILHEYSPVVEKVGIDEAFVDLTGTERLFGPVAHTCRTIQRRVWEELQLGVSVGLATNKLVAKVASDFRKPRGFTVVRRGDEARFLAGGSGEALRPTRRHEKCRACARRSSPCAQGARH